MVTVSFVDSYTVNPVAVVKTMKLAEIMAHFFVLKDLENRLFML